MSQLTLDRAILDALHERVASAARLVGQIQDGTAPGGTLDLLAENIDQIAHELGGLLGNRHVSAADARLTNVTIHRAILEVLLDQIASAARRVGQIAPGRTLDLLAAVLERAASTARLLGQIEEGNPYVRAYDLLLHNLNEISNEIGKIRADPHSMERVPDAQEDAK